MASRPPRRVVPALAIAFVAGLVLGLAVASNLIGQRQIALAQVGGEPQSLDARILALSFGLASIAVDSEDSAQKLNALADRLTALERRLAALESRAR